MKGALFLALIVVSIPLAASAAAAPPTTAAKVTGPGTGKPGERLQFDGSSSTASNNSTIASYAWSFDDGAKAIGVRPNHTFDRAGRYNVTLAIVTSKGETSTTLLPVLIANATPATNVTNVTTPTNSTPTSPTLPKPAPTPTPPSKPTPAPVSPAKPAAATTKPASSASTAQKTVPGGTTALVALGLAGAALAFRRRE